MSIGDDILQKASRLHKRLVFPEGSDERILKACHLLIERGIAQPYLVGSRPAIERRAVECGVSIDGCEVRDPAYDVNMPRYVEELVHIRQHKGVDEQKAKVLLSDPKYFAAMMVRMGDADGCITGATHPTAQTILPAVQVIKTKAEFSLASSYFLMVKDEQVMFFADCGFVVNPNATELGDIAIATADSASSFGFKPKVALLSFSTHGSAKHDMITKVQQAKEHVLAHRPKLIIDGELQFDAAFVPEVAASKCPDSAIMGDANVFVFPDLNAGNIAYKIAQRLGGFQAIGPILQGLNKPMNDLSRGCSVDDIVMVAAITAIQSE